jgi:hypothetical protein
MADVEVATNPTLLSIVNLNQVVFRGLTFQYANSCHGQPAVTVVGPSSNILFDSDAFVWNSGQGLAVSNPATNITVINSISNHNGAAGFQAFEVKNILWQNNQASYNNWRGAQGAYYSWNTGGYHLFSDHEDTVSGGSASFNQTFGIHWDTDLVNVTAWGVVVSQNVWGLLYEKGEGSAFVTNNLFCSNSQGPGGFIVRNSENLTLSGNTFYNNSGAQMAIIGVAGGIPIQNWETGQNYNLVSSDVTMATNVFDSVGAEQVFQDGGLGGSDWTAFQSTLISNFNIWWNNTVNPTPFTVPVPSAGTMVNFPGWQATTRQDALSSFTQPPGNPAAACAAVTADGPDWQFLVENPALTTNAANLTTNAAGQAVFNLSALSLGGLAGTATFAVDGIARIAGASVSFSPTTLTIPGTSALTFTVGAQTPPGTYLFTVLANSGDTTRTATLSVTIPASSILLSTVQLTYNNQPEGETSAVQTVTVTNISSSAVSISSIVLSVGFAEPTPAGPRWPQAPTAPST